MNVQEETRLEGGNGSAGGEEGNRVSNENEAQDVNHQEDAPFWCKTLSQTIESTGYESQVNYSWNGLVATLSGSQSGSMTHNQYGYVTSYQITVDGSTTETTMTYECNDENTSHLLWRCRLMSQDINAPGYQSSVEYTWNGPLGQGTQATLSGSQTGTLTHNEYGFLTEAIITVNGSTSTTTTTYDCEENDNQALLLRCRTLNQTIQSEGYTSSVDYVWNGNTATLSGTQSGMMIYNEFGYLTESNLSVNGGSSKTTTNYECGMWAH